MPDDAASDHSTSSGDSDGDAQDSDDFQSMSSSASCPQVDTLIIFDWDDTLFPTTWLQRQGMLSAGVGLGSMQLAQLENIAAFARSTLETAAQIGKVVIITNAERGWVEKSCTKFMPSLVKLLKTIDIVSARTAYEQPEQMPADWKRLAFEQEIDFFYEPSHPDQYLNIISLGDSHHEVNALKSVANRVPKSFRKSIKLLELPSIDQLLQQHEFLLSCLLDVAEHHGDLDVEIGAEDVE